MGIAWKYQGAATREIYASACSDSRPPASASIARPGTTHSTAGRVRSGVSDLQFEAK